MTRMGTPILQSTPNQAIESAVEPTTPKSRLEHWTTGLIIAAAVFVYLGIFLRSPVLFIGGEGACLILAPFVIWFERDRVRKWWAQRGKCPICQNTLTITAHCPVCDAKAKRK